MRFEISRQARRQIDKIQSWWTDNRPTARSMFLDDLESAERLLRDNPEAGIHYADHESGAIRRVLLSQTEYHLYYRYRRDRGELIVLKVHGATRKHGPRF